MSTLARHARSIVACAALAGIAAHASPAHAEQETTVQWNENWPRVHLVEVGAIVGLTIGSVLYLVPLTLGVEVASQSHLHGMSKFLTSRHPG